MRGCRRKYHITTTTKMSGNPINPFLRDRTAFMFTTHSQIYVLHSSLFLFFPWSVDLFSAFPRLKLKHLSDLLKIISHTSNR